MSKIVMLCLIDPERCCLFVWALSTAILLLRFSFLDLYYSKLSLATLCQGDQGAKRAAYEAKWQSLVTMSGPVLHADVPWLPDNENGAQALILYGVQNAAERKKRLRLELMRWHPDKFVAKFGGRVIAKDRERVAEGVKRVSQMLNSLGT